jgi:hypothetical protein
VQRVLSERLAAALWSEHGAGERVRALLAAGGTPYDVVEEIASTLFAPARG